MFRTATVPLRLIARVLDRVQFLLDDSPVALSRTARRVRLAVAALAVGYGVMLLASGGLRLVAGAVVIAVAAVVAAGRLGLFARDWAPAFGMMAVYGVAFAAAASLNMPTWYGPQIEADRLLGLGHVPSVWLQQHLDAAHSQGLAVWTASAYASHYYFPVMLGLYVWWRHRDDGFFDLIYGYLTALVLATVVFVLAPTAPPWLASERGLLPPLHDVVRSGLLDLHLTTLADHKGDPHLYLTRAAFPSVHAAWPMVSLLVAFRHRLPRPVQALVVLQLASVWFAIVYGGEHYVSDVLAGALVAVVATMLVERHRERLARAVFDRDGVRAVGPADPEVVVVRTRLRSGDAARLRD
ncbi:MAG TPA: phosphatase PAP2 family protein [Gaiellales bacterium]